MFNTLDISCDGQIDYKIMDYIMKQTQFSFKPKDFEALIRRLSFLNPKNGHQVFFIHIFNEKKLGFYQLRRLQKNDVSSLILF